MSKNKNQNNVTELNPAEGTGVPEPESETNEVKKTFVDRQYEKYCDRRQKRIDKKEAREQKPKLSTKAKVGIGITALTAAVGTTVGVILHTGSHDEDCEHEGEDRYVEDHGNGTEASAEEGVE